jgi:hypothetical protein
MANTTAWTGGTLNSGLGWTLANSASDFQSLAGGKAALSSAADLTNGTGLDQFYDLSFVGAIASTTLTSGANISIYLYMLLQNGTTYGDNSFTAGSGSTHTITATIIGQAPVAIMPQAITGAGATVISGQAFGLLLPPGSFRFALANNLLPSTAFSAGTQSLYFRTYDQNLNR